MAVIFATGVLPALSQQGQQNTTRPNIIFIFSDDHAYQAISAYGSRLAQTPNIDRIAREGAIFKNAFVTNSICGPSRASLLTGKYSHQNGFKVNEREKFNTNQQVFPALLQKTGYQTAWIGKWHLGSLPTGFDYFNILPGQGHYYNPDFINPKNDTTRLPGYVTNIITELSTQWIDKRDTSRPFFLVIGEKATHREWLPDLQDLGAYDSVTFPLPPNFYDNYKGRDAAAHQDMTIDKTMVLGADLKVHLDYKSTSPSYTRFSEDQKRLFADYYEKVNQEFDHNKHAGKALAAWKYQRYMKDYLSVAKSLDRNIGQVLDYLDKTGLSKNTVVIYASDQGFYLGEHGWFDKRFIYEESLRTPFVMRYPGVIKPGTVVEEFTINSDWAPTLLDVAKMNIPQDMQGKSFLPLLLNQKAGTWRKDVYYHYYEYPQPHHVYPHFGMRNDRYKLIYFYGDKNSWELFDLSKDPREMNNLYGSPGMAGVTSQLKARLRELIIEYKDDEALQLFDVPRKNL